MRLAWQGFRLEHPEGWVPAHLAGNRREGYLRIDSSARTALHIRWKSVRRPGDLALMLVPYERRLASDARGARLPFLSEHEWDGTSFVYRWTGRGQGRGYLFLAPGCGRVFFLEASGGPTDELQDRAHDARQSFASGPDGDVEPWALFGLDVQIPLGYTLGRHHLQPERARLEWRHKRCRLVAERWAFGSQLVAKHGLEPWARTVLGMPGGEVAASQFGLELTSRDAKGLKPRHALVRFDPARNQLTTLAQSGPSADILAWDWIL